MASRHPAVGDDEVDLAVDRARSVGPRSVHPVIDDETVAEAVAQAQQRARLRPVAIAGQGVEVEFGGDEAGHGGI